MKNVINTIINGIEFMVNRVVDGINNMINALNRLSFDIPDWVPQLGGKFWIFYSYNSNCKYTSPCQWWYYDRIYISQYWRSRKGSSVAT